MGYSIGAKDLIKRMQPIDASVPIVGIYLLEDEHQWPAWLHWTKRPEPQHLEHDQYYTYLGATVFRTIRWRHQETHYLAVLDRWDRTRRCWVPVRHVVDEPDALEIARITDPVTQQAAVDRVVGRWRERLPGYAVESVL